MPGSIPPQNVRNSLRSNSLTTRRGIAPGIVFIPNSVLPYIKTLSFLGTNSLWEFVLSFRNRNQEGDALAQNRKFYRQGVGKTGRIPARTC
ncbi:MAG: hypothetical protein GY754_43130 [bacterium]|nr:hypothetical protein [bacterium]